MEKILVAVDDTKCSLQLIEVVAKLFSHNWPETVLLLYVEKIMGRSLMDDVLLSDSEIETLKKSLKGTEHQEMLDSKAEKVIDFFIWVRILASVVPYSKTLEIEEYHQYLLTSFCFSMAFEHPVRLRWGE